MTTVAATTALRPATAAGECMAWVSAHGDEGPSEKGAAATLRHGRGEFGEIAKSSPRKP